MSVNTHMHQAGADNQVTGSMSAGPEKPRNTYNSCGTWAWGGGGGGGGGAWKGMEIYVTEEAMSRYKINTVSHGLTRMDRA